MFCLFLPRAQFERRDFSILFPIKFHLSPSAALLAVLDTHTWDLGGSPSVPLCNNIELLIDDEWVSCYFSLSVTDYEKHPQFPTRLAIDRGGNK